MGSIFQPYMVTFVREEGMFPPPSAIASPPGYQLQPSVHGPTSGSRHSSPRDNLTPEPLPLGRTAQ